ncbi:MAG: ACP S-malonyltransferase [Candidatus Omnitrophota bacterium]
MVAFIFPGQGAQYVGMGEDLYEAFAESREVFDAADRILGLRLSKLCFEGPAEELTRTVNCQPAIFTMSIAALAAFKSDARYQMSDVRYMAGLSLGEYTALAAAGAISFEDGLLLVAQRARFMDEAAIQKPGRMSSILGLDFDKIQKIAQESGIEIANLNCPGQVVITGSAEAVNRANNLALKHGARRAINLEVSGAFHSSLMHSAAVKLSKALADINIKASEVPVISNITAAIESSPEEIKNNLIRQLTGSVLWEKSVRFMLGSGVNKIFEIGPGKVLRGLVRKIDAKVEVVNISKSDEIKKE